MLSNSIFSDARLSEHDELWQSFLVRGNKGEGNYGNGRDLEALSTAHGVHR